MDAFLIKFIYFARPLLGGFVNYQIFGLTFFEAATIVLTAALLLVYVHVMMSRRKEPLSRIEVWMLVFFIWCLFSSILNYDLVVGESIIKWVLPPATYIILRRTINDLELYGKCINWMMLGFVVPIGLSAYLTSQGINIDEEVFKTGAQRYRGIYSGIHEMGHNTGLCIMFICIYITLARLRGAELGLKMSWIRYGFLAVLALLAGYCLIHTYVRTVFVGLTIFIFVFLYFYSKKALVLFGAGAVVAGIVFFSVITSVFYDVLDTRYVGKNYENAGFGRTAIWERNLNNWLNVPIENKIAGVGIGNWVGNRVPKPSDGFQQLNNSHNDWLSVTMESGIVGLIIILGLYMAIFRTIWRFGGRERYAFIAFFLAVSAMNMLSNSYISRVPLAQMFYMLLVYVEIAGMRRFEEPVEKAYKDVHSSSRRILNYGLEKKLSQHS